MTDDELRLRIELALREALYTAAAVHALRVAIEEARAELVEIVVASTPVDEPTKWRRAAAEAIHRAKS